MIFFPAHTGHGRQPRVALVWSGSALPNLLIGGIMQYNLNEIIDNLTVIMANIKLIKKNNYGELLETGKLEMLLNADRYCLLAQRQLEAIIELELENEN